MSWIYIFITGFVGGLLALFTPCVWPIIPMTVSFFLKRSKDKKKGIRDAWTYGGRGSFNLAFFRNNRYRLFGNSFFCATFAF